jgi:glycosyltransferase involved in cell wall biosynthesis
LTQRPLVSVLVPAYNEDQVLGESLGIVHTYCQMLDAFRFEIVVIDDGSIDDTLEIAEAFATQHAGEVTVVHHPTNRHLGGALRSGIATSKGDYIVVLDADLSYAVEHIERLLAALITTKSAVAIASPYMEGGKTVAVPRKLEVRSRAANRWLRLTAQEDVATLTGMVRAYEGPWARALPIKAEDVDVNVEILYKAMLLRAPIVEVPATLDWSRLAHRSSRSTIVASERDRWNIYKSLVAGFIFRPFLFPAITGLVTAGLGLVLFIVCSTGSKLDLLGLVGIVVGSMLVWQSLSLLQAKRYFEEQFLSIYRLQRTLDRAQGTSAPSVASVDERHTSTRSPL